MKRRDDNERALDALARRGVDIAGAPPRELRQAIHRLALSTTDAALRRATERSVQLSDEAFRAWLRRNRGAVERIARSSAPCIVLPESLTAAAKQLPHAEALAVAAVLSRADNRPYRVWQLPAERAP